MKNLQARGILLLMIIIALGMSCRSKHNRHHHDHDYSVFGPMIFPSKQPDQIILNLTDEPVHSVAVNWRTDTTISAGIVQVALATHGPEHRKQASDIMAETTNFTHQYEDEPRIQAHFHSARLKDLLPGEKYVYRVGHAEYWSEWFQIQMPDTTGSLSFIYFGDAQNDVKSMWSRVIREAYSTLPRVDFMLHAGDLINRHNRDREWGEWFYAGSFIHAMVPSVMTPGNHEYGDEGLSPQWKPQFNLPANGPAGLEETCYAVDYPQLKVISLDAEMLDESESMRRAQTEWLDSILTHHPRKWIAVTLHYPLFSTKPDRDNVTIRESLKPVFDKHQVDLVLQGHDHAYGRGRVSNVETGAYMHNPEAGTMYVVSVSGPKMYDVEDADWMQRRAGQTQLFQVISITNDTLEYQAFTARGEPYDAFNLIKQPEGPVKLVEIPVSLEERLPM